MHRTSTAAHMQVATWLLPPDANTRYTPRTPHITRRSSDCDRLLPPAAETLLHSPTATGSSHRLHIHPTLLLSDCDRLFPPAAQRTYTPHSCSQIATGSSCWLRNTRTPHTRDTVQGYAETSLSPPTAPSSAAGGRLSMPRTRSLSLRVSSAIAPKNGAPGSMARAGASLRLLELERELAR